MGVGGFGGETIFKQAQNFKTQQWQSKKVFNHIIIETNPCFPKAIAGLYIGLGYFFRH